MRLLKIATLILAIAGLSSVASASVFFEDFESYTAGSALHGQGGWKGWNNTPGAGAPVSSDFAYSGANSVEIVPAADLVHEFDVTGGLWILTAMQYIPSGTSGTTWFILLNTYSDNGTQDWSVQTQFVLDDGTITSSYDSGTMGTIIYDQWVEIKCVIDLDNNTVDEYYNGELITTHQWDNDQHDTLQVIDLYADGASSIYYDDIQIEAPTHAHNPEPADGTLFEATWATLKWTPGGEAVSHDVYLGEDYDAVNEGAAETFRGNQMTNFYVVGFPGFAYPEGLVPGTTYYWRIDEINEQHPDSPWVGEVWSFTVPPRKAYNPDPADTAQYVIPDDVTLSWSPGFGATVHYVYFGDNFDEINNATTGAFQPGTTYSAGQLEMGKEYYWRIDEFDGLNTIKGDVWSFKTLPNIAVTDPNFVCWWKLDEGQGSTAVDWSGHGHNGTFRGSPEWVQGYDGSALHFAAETDFVVHSLGAATDWAAGTISLWVKPDAVGQNQYSSVFSSHVPNSAGFQLDVDGGNPGVYRVNPPGGQTLVFGIVTTDWVHLAMTFDGTSTNLYYNGDWTSSGTLNDTTFNQFAIAQNRNVENSIFGIIDDFRVYDKVLTIEEIQDTLRSDLLVAWEPSPSNGSTPDIENALPLTWSAGDEATQHDVYFGVDQDAVDLADTSDTSGIYRGRQNAVSYTPSEGVEWAGGPYFWRIDEINADGTVTKGRLWAFTVADFILVDDFEGYTNDDAAGEAIWQSWIDGFGVADNGAQVGNLVPPYSEHTIVHSGSQSMPLMYNNSLGVTNSEAVFAFASSRDWTQHNLANLSLWFRGDSANAPEPFYIIVGDNAGTGAIAVISDPGVTQITTWTEWTLQLKPFADIGVDLTNVGGIMIGLGTKGNPAATGGSGTMYIDDIRLYPQ